MNKVRPHPDLRPQEKEVAKSLGGLRDLLVATALTGVGTNFHLTAEETTSRPRPVMQASPVAREEVAFHREGVGIARYYFGHDLTRLFVFPIIETCRGSLTRVGHPNAPETDSDGNSVWIARRDDNGLVFWEDRG